MKDWKFPRILGIKTHTIYKPPFPKHFLITPQEQLPQKWYIKAM